MEASLKHASTPGRRKVRLLWSYVNVLPNKALQSNDNNKATQSNTTLTEHTIKAPFVAMTNVVLPVNLWLWIRLHFHAALVNARDRVAVMQLLVATAAFHHKA